MGAGCQSGFDLRHDNRGGGRAAPDESEERPEVARRDEPGEEQAWDARLEACVQDGTAVDRLEIASQMGASEVGHGRGSHAIPRGQDDVIHAESLLIRQCGDDLSC